MSMSAARRPPQGRLPQGRPPEGIVFDLDGTLWDSTAAVAEAWDAAVRRRHAGHPPITPADIRGVMGMAHRQLLERLLPQHPPEEQERLAALCYAEEKRRLRAGGGAVYAGVPEGLAALQRRYPLFIVSNCQAGYIETFLDVTRLRARFRDFECHGNTGRTKAENLAGLLRRNRIAQALLVGDTAGDQQAARAVGIPFLHAAYGFGSAEAPDLRCEDFGQVVRACQAWPST
jgi:phosphoglycolate phosphatase